MKNFIFILLMILDIVSVQAAELTKMEEASLYVKEELKMNHYQRTISYGNIVSLRAFEGSWSKTVSVITEYSLDLDKLKGSFPLSTKEEYNLFHNTLKKELFKLQIKKVCTDSKLKTLLKKGIQIRNTFIWTNIKDNVITTPVFDTNVIYTTCIENGYIKKDSLGK